jgi:hypothetical protein
MNNKDKAKYTPSAVGWRQCPMDERGPLHAQRAFMMRKTMDAGGVGGGERHFYSL